MSDDDKFKDTIEKLKGLALQLREAPVEEADKLSDDDVRAFYRTSLLLHQVVGSAIQLAVKELEKSR